VGQLARSAASADGENDQQPSAVRMMCSPDLLMTAAASAFNPCRQVCRRCVFPAAHLLLVSHIQQSHLLRTTAGMKCELDDAQIGC
jgi:hypothetical protein